MALKTCVDCGEVGGRVIKNRCGACYQKYWTANVKKTCIECGSNSSIGSWYRGPKCDKCYQKKHYKLNHRRFGAGQKFCRGRSGARKRGIIWDIDLETYKTIISTGCYYCGLNLFTETGHGLDKQEPNLGYIINNVVPCCGNCNTIKNSILTKDETIEVIRLLKTIRSTTGSPWELILTFTDQ